jgi:Flp pilus assembly protein TadG
VKTMTTFRLLKCGRGIAALEFAILAPALLALVFSIIVYSIYFSATIGVQQAASEGARAAVAGLSSTERENLARARVAEVIQNYRSVLGSNTPQASVTTATSSGVFKVTVTYDMSGAPVMKYSGFIPLPKRPLTASVTVTNGGY